MCVYIYIYTHISNWIRIYDFNVIIFLMWQFIYGWNYPIINKLSCLYVYVYTVIYFVVDKINKFKIF